MADAKVRTRLTLDGAEFQRGMRRASSQVAEFRRGAEDAFRKVSLAAGAAAFVVGKIGVQFEQSMANIAAATNATDEQLGKLSHRARDLGKQTAYSASQVADAMTVLAKAGLSVEENVSGIEGVLKLAGSEMGDMEQTAELVVSTMRAFRLQFSEAGRVANTLAAVSQATRQSIDRLSDSLSYASVISRDLGVSFEEATAAVGVLVDVGLDASTAGTSLRGALGDLVGPSKELAAALEGLNINVGRDGLVKTLDKLAEAGIRGERVYQLFEKRTASAVSTIIENRERLRELTTEITGTNAAWRAYDRQQATTLGAFRRFKSALEEVALAVYDTFGTSWRDSLDRAAKWVIDNERRIVRAFVSVKETVQELLVPFGALVTWIRDNDEVLTRLAATAAIATTALWGLAAAQGAVNVAMKLHPITAAATGAVLLFGWAVSGAIDTTEGWAIGLAKLWGKIRGVAENMRYAGEVVGYVVKTLGQAWVHEWGDVSLHLIKLALSLTKEWVRIFAAAGAAAMRLFFEPWRAPEEIAHFTAEIAKAVANAAVAVKVHGGDAWNEYREIHSEALAAIEEEHRGRLGRIAAETEERLRKLRESLNNAGPKAPPVEQPWQVPMAGGPGFDKPFPTFELEDSVERQTRAASKVWQRYASDLEALYEDTWDSLLDMDMTGKQRREAVWEGIKRSTFRAIGEIVKNVVISETVQAKLTAAAEAARTSAKATGAAARAGISATEVARSNAETSANVGTAVSGTLAAHSRIPLVGIGIALGFVGLILATMRRLPKFALGGLVGGQENDGNVVRVGRGEFIMPAGKVKEFGSILEGMRSGSIPSARSLLGAGAGTGASYQVIVERGSLLVVEDEAAFERFADRVYTAIERGVKRRVKLPAAGGARV